MNNNFTKDVNKININFKLHDIINKILLIEYKYDNYNNLLDTQMFIKFIKYNIKNGKINIDTNVDKKIISFFKRIFFSHTYFYHKDKVRRCG